MIDDGGPSPIGTPILRHGSPLLCMGQGSEGGADEGWDDIATDFCANSPFITERKLHGGQLTECALLF